MKYRILLMMVLTCVVTNYTCPSSTRNELVTQVQTQGPSQNNAKIYTLFDTNMQGTLQPIYDNSSGQLKFIEKVNDSMIRLLPY
mgnify:FL=1